MMLISCRNQPEKAGSETPTAAKSRYAALLAKCPDLVFDDTLAVYSISEPDNEAYPFRGIQINRTEGQYLPVPIRNGLESEVFGTYACGSFAINPDHTGILLRIPAPSGSNAVCLLVLDKRRDSITGMLELSQLYRDAGDFVDKKSWLFRNRERQPAAFMWELQTYDHSIEDDADNTIDRTDHYYLFNLSQPQPDTVSGKANDLAPAFKRQDRR